MFDFFKWIEVLFYILWMIYLDKLKVLIEFILFVIKFIELYMYIMIIDKKKRIGRFLCYW